MNSPISEGVWFSQLNPEHLDQLRRIAEREVISAGAVLFLEGDRSDSMYFVESGRLSVVIEGQTVAEIDAGHTVGEIGFLSGDPRTATVAAVRDSIVLKLKRQDYELLCKTYPLLLQDICRSLARKVTEANKVSRGGEYHSPRTITLSPGGKTAIASEFVDLFLAVLSNYGTCKLITRIVIETEIASNQLSSEKAIQWRNQQENSHDYLVYLSDSSDQEWADIAVRHADIFLTLCDASMSDSEDIKPNKMELLFEKTLDQNIHWLVLLHSQSRNLRNASQWLDERHVESLHHVIADDEAFIQRLVRFICGTATGLVASGGGAYAAAHLGCFKAFDEAGIQFDILGGASGGAAMIASVAGNVGYEDMLARTGEMMVNSKALKRYTVPRFGLVDHIYFDRCLQEQFGRENNIEDFWTNFFAVSTNLSTGQEELHRRGKIWKAVRASASIPGVLPPFIAENGDLLVDGGVINNVPLSVMKSLKHGPNIVLTFQTKHQNKAGIQYGQLPGRRRQLLGLLGSFGKSRNIAMPGIGSVLMQSMLLNNDSLNHAGEEDLILTMDLPKDIKLNDWGRYQQVAHMGYQQAKAWLQQHENHPVLKKIKKAAWVKSV